MKRIISELFKRFLQAFAKRLSVERFIQLVLLLVRGHIKGKSPAEALKVLFILDARLYTEQSLLAVAYDGGIHTKHRHMNYHDFFCERVNEDDHILDIGCGIGAVAYDLSRVAEQVVGVDFNAESINIARQRYQNPNLTFYVGNALEVLPDEQFSVVILSNVLEHLSGRPAFLRRVRDTVRPERILIRVPVFERDWRVPLKKELGVEWRLDRTHETEYTLETFAQEMLEANLHIDHLEVRWGEIWSEVLPNS